MYTECVWRKDLTITLDSVICGPLSVHYSDQTLPPKSGMGSELQQYICYKCEQDDVGTRGCVSEFDTSFVEAIREVCPTWEHNASEECHFPQDKLKKRLVNSCQPLSDEVINQCPPLGYVAGSIHLLNSSNSLTVCILKKLKLIIVTFFRCPTTLSSSVVIGRAVQRCTSSLLQRWRRFFCNHASSIAALSLREAGDVIVSVYICDIV